MRLPEDTCAAKIQSSYTDTPRTCMKPREDNRHVPPTECQKLDCDGHHVFVMWPGPRPERKVICMSDMWA